MIEKISFFYNSDKPVMGIEPMTFALQVRCKLTTVLNGLTVDFSTTYPLEDPLSPFNYSIIMKTLK
jgi:hypothetical protein